MPRPWLPPSPRQSQSKQGIDVIPRRTACSEAFATRLQFASLLAIPLGLPEAGARRIKDEFKVLIAMLTALAIGFGIVVGLLLIYGVPLYFIWRERHVPDRERVLWMLACVLVPWVPFLAFMLVAPLSGVRGR